MPLEENIKETRKVVEAASKYGIDVEGECGTLPDASGSMGGHSSHKLTDPDEAACFVTETGVCSLSIAIGNEHIKTNGKSGINFDLLARIQKASSMFH